MTEDFANTVGRARPRTGLREPLFVLALLLFTVGVSLPAVLYFNNAKEFSINLADLLWVSVPAFLLCMAICAALVWALPFLRRPRPVALLFVATLLLWIHGNVLVWQYGPLDGRAIDWSLHRQKGIVDASLWGLALALAMWKPRPIVRAAAFLAPLLLVLQAAALIWTGATMPKVRVEGTVKAYDIDPAPKFSLSRDTNAFLIVLDEVQSDIFSELVTNDETLARIFEGFVYFPDAVAGGSYTELAIPALLTGRIYDNSEPKESFLSAAYLNDSVFSHLKRSGAHVDIYPWVGWANETIYFDEAIADNLVRKDGTESREAAALTEKGAKEIVHLADLALFRSAPHFLKPVVYNDQRWLIMGLVSNFVSDEVKATVSTDNEYETSVFADQAERELRVDRDGRVFKYYHLKGGHSPLSVTEDLRVTTDPVPFSRQNYSRQVRLSIQSLGRFFAQLERLGEFDDSLIVIASDHGSGMSPEVYLGTSAGTKLQSPPGVAESRRNFAKDKARGVPLLLVKRAGSTGPMVVSQKAAAAVDVPATIVAEFVATVPSRGESLLDGAQSRTRTRNYAAFDYSENRTSYVGPITLYSITGSSWDDASWSIADVLLPAPDRAPQSDR